MNIDIKSMYLNEIEKLVLSKKYPKFRAKQIYDWLHKKYINTYDEMKNVPNKLIEDIKIEYDFSNVKLFKEYTDENDNTKKLLFKLNDGNLIETVLMQYKYGASVCISSQVGCRMGCNFCASTINGLNRNLTAGEMLGQIYYIEKTYNIKVHSIVVMGIGEPMDNYDNLVRFAKIMSSEDGRNLSRRNITVSTCGVVPKIIQFAKDLPQVNLAISLHFTDDEKRSDIMPINRKYKIEELLDAVDYYIEKTNRRVTFEYALIEGQNDTIEEAKKLADLIGYRLCHINLIPINPVDERNYEGTDKENAKKFMQVLLDRKIQTTIRRSLGQSIDAACGQLRNKNSDN